MFENPRRAGKQKILVLKSCSEQTFSKNWRWVPLKVWCLSAQTRYSHSKTPKFTRNQYRRPDGVCGNPYISFFVTNNRLVPSPFGLKLSNCIGLDTDCFNPIYNWNCRFICYFNTSGYIILTLSQHCLKTVLQSQYCVNISSALCNHCLNIPTTLSWNGLNILPASILYMMVQEERLHKIILYSWRLSCSLIISLKFLFPSDEEIMGILLQDYFGSG